MNEVNSKTILVTGGAGFIGSHLCERLVADGHKVISLDNYFTGSKDNHVEGVEYREGHTKDITKHIPESLDLVYHLGEYSRVLTSFDDVELVHDYNIVGTFSVLEFCRNRAVKLVYAGSSTKFGDDLGGRNNSPYAWTKATNTELVKNFGEWYNLPYAITYFYNVYGGRELSEGKYATVVGIFARKYKNKEPLTVVSPGTQKRAFTHINDIVDGLVVVGNKGEGDGYCIGSSEEYSILDLAKMFGGDIQMLPAKKGDRMVSAADFSKTQGLGWEARHHLSDYIDSLKKND